MQLDLALTLSQITLLSPIEFQRQLAPLRDSPLILKLLSDLLASTLTDQQKQLAAVGINQVVVHRLDTDRQQWRSIWMEYLSCLLDGPEIEAIAWRHFKITGRALEKLMEEFQENFCDCVNTVFKGLHFKSKAIIYETFLYVETTEKTKNVFVRQTFEDYVTEALEFACRTHEAPPNADLFKLEMAVMENLSELMSALKRFSHGPIVELMLKVGTNVELFLLVVEELLFDPAKGDYASVMKQEFSPQRMRELVLSTDSEEINILKAKAVKVLVALLAQYDFQAGLEEFDHHKHLFFMESLTPMVAEHLVFLAKEMREGTKEVIEQLLAFLTISAKFNFLLQTFQNLYQKLFYRVCVPLLATTAEQHELYASDSAQFIKISQELIESSDEKCETIKNSAGVFLQQLSSTVHGSLTLIVQISTKAILSLLTPRSFPELAEATQSYDFKPSIDTCLILLSLFSSSYQKRPELHKYLREELLSTAELESLEELEKARLLIFLTYNYEDLFKGNPEEGRRFLIYADRGFEQSKTISSCSALLFNNCLELGFGDDIWSSLVGRIEGAKDTEVFELLSRIVEKMLNDLPGERVKDLISRVIFRLVGQFGKCEEQAKGGTVKGSKVLFCCLDILSTIASNHRYLKEEAGIIDSIWPVFDMFEYSERIEFEDNILTIFNQVLAVEKHLVHRHFSFLPFFLPIYEKWAGLGDLLDTVNLLLTKGRDYLLTEESARRDLEAVMSFLRETYGVLKNEDTLKHVLVLFHYIHWEYGSLLSLDRPFVDRVREVYEVQKEFMGEEAKAALINFLILCECKYGGVDLSLIAENRIQIFRGYQGKLFASGLRSLIEKQPEHQLLLTYLRYSIRLLHFIRETKLAPSPRSDYYSPRFPETDQLDPFSQICHSLNFIKRVLPPAAYDQILSELNSEISLGEIKDLLSRRLVDNSLRAIRRVRME